MNKILMTFSKTSECLSDICISNPLTVTHTQIHILTLPLSDKNNSNMSICLHILVYLHTYVYVYVCMWGKTFILQEVHLQKGVQKQRKNTNNAEWNENG